MFILDTNVVSELRKVRAGKADSRLTQWADEVDAESLHISTISVLELEIGILQMERREPTQGAILRTWLETRVLPEFDAPRAPACARSARRARRFDRSDSSGAWHDDRDPERC